MRFTISLLALAASTPALAANIAIFEDYSAAPVSAMGATALGHSSLVFFADGLGFANACAAADLCIVEASNWLLGADGVNAINTAIANGKPVIVTHWAFQTYDEGMNAPLGIIPTDFYTSFSQTGAGSYNFYQGLAGGQLTWQGSDIFGVNGSTFTLAGAGWIGSAQNNVAVTNSDRSIAFGIAPYDFASIDTDGDAMWDLAEVYGEMIDFLLGGGGPRPTINLVGSPCPSSVTAQATGFTGGGTVAIVRSNGTGAAVIPSGPCAGTTLGLSTSGLGLITTITAPPSGNINYAGSVSAGVCGKYIQMVDMATCTVSNVDQF
jgi:hypothetical protein